MSQPNNFHNLNKITSKTVVELRESTHSAAKLIFKRRQVASTSRSVCVSVGRSVCPQNEIQSEIQKTTKNKCTQKLHIIKPSLRRGLSRLLYLSEFRVDKSGLKIISYFSSIQRLHFPVTGENGSALFTISHLTW